MAFLQAVIDDSASETGDRRLFLAGYLNSARNWALFADAWDEELKAGRPIRYLKMSEANSLRGEFERWTPFERDEKLRGLKRVARHFGPLTFHTSISRAHSQTLKPVTPRGFANPHFLCSINIVTMVTRHVDKVAAEDGKLAVPIEFIFDQQNGVESDIDQFFDLFMKHLPNATRKLISHRPVFKDEKLYTPLQAADMLAWHLRRSHEENGDWTVTRDPIPVFSGRGHLHSEIDPLIGPFAETFAKSPKLSQLTNKAQWRRFKNNLKEIRASGFIPPRRTKLRNLAHGFRKRLLSLFLWKR